MSSATALFKQGLQTRIKGLIASIQDEWHFDSESGMEQLIQAAPAHSTYDMSLACHAFGRYSALRDVLEGLGE